MDTLRPMHHDPSILGVSVMETLMKLSKGTLSRAILAAALVAMPAIAQDGGEGAEFSFPPEWEEHEAVWMGWQDFLSEQEDFAILWAEMISALSPHVDVKMIVKSEDMVETAMTLLAEREIGPEQVEFVIQDSSDIWLRDSGGLFISNGSELRIADFAWDTYGFPSVYVDADDLERAEIDGDIADGMGLERRPSEIIAEGGGLEVNSDVLITYKDAMVHRNPEIPLEDIEAELLRLYGKEKLIWLDRAPISDRIFIGPKVGNFFGWGANGHVDEYVRFVDESTIFVAQVAPEESELNALLELDDEILKENFAQLEEATDANGNPFNVVPVPMPDITALMYTYNLTEDDFTDPRNGKDLRSVYRDFEVGDEVHIVPAASYLNFLVTNGVVLVASYWQEGLPERLKETDEEMRRLLAEQYPDRQIVQINPMAVNWLGGGMHCITQQEPKITPPADPA
ncbi:MAG: agmatine deiminase family protein [Pseudomonadota bacterium]